MNNYPIDLDECMKIGIWGGCGMNCPIYQAGECEYSEDIKTESEGES